MPTTFAEKRAEVDDLIDDVNIRDYLLMRSVDSPAIAWAVTVDAFDSPNRVFIDLYLRYCVDEDVFDRIMIALLTWPDHTGLQVLARLAEQDLPGDVLLHQFLDGSLRKDILKKAGL